MTQQKNSKGAKGPKERIYLWEDVFVSAGRIAHYMPNQGNDWSFSEDLRYDLVGMFGHLRPFGRAPRGVNLWELDWRRFSGALSEQFGKTMPKGFEAWWMRSNVDRAGGWDRVMRPGPGSPALQDLQQGDKRPCVVEQRVRLRDGAQDDYLDWFAREAGPAIAPTGWQPMMWLGALHSSFVVTTVAAPDWSRVLDLSAALPQPDPAWQAQTETVALQAWAGSGFLKR